MAYNEKLAERIRAALSGIYDIEEKKMMGGLTFMVNGKMCVGIYKNELMARIDPDDYDMAMSQKGCRVMDFTGKPMKGFVLVSSEGTGDNEGLEYWVKLALKYNDKAKASKKRKK